jgi:hypothetical protein
VDAFLESLRRGDRRSSSALPREVDPEVPGSSTVTLTAGRGSTPDGRGTAFARAAGSVERLDLCTRCNHDRFFSHRYSGPRHGAQGVIGAVAG